MTPLVSESRLGIGTAPVKQPSPGPMFRPPHNGFNGPPSGAPQGPPSLGAPAIRLPGPPGPYSSAGPPSGPPSLSGAPTTPVGLPAMSNGTRHAMGMVNGAPGIHPSPSTPNFRTATPVSQPPGGIRPSYSNSNLAVNGQVI